MNKRAAYIILLVAVAFNALAATGAGNKENFITQAGAFYKAHVAKLHQKNLYHLQKNELDSLQTNITIDLANWKYNDRKEKWEMLAPDPGVSSITFAKKLFYYRYDLQTENVEKDSSYAQSTGMHDYNKAQYAKKDKGLLLYCINVINMPLLKVNKGYDNLAVDTTKTIWETLNKLDYSDNGWWQSFLSMNTDFGHTIFQGIDAYVANEEFSKVVLLFTSYSEVVPYGEQGRRFRYYNYYGRYIEENLDQTLRSAIYSFQYNTEVKLDGLVNAFVDVLECHISNHCDELFQTDEAKQFWTQFMGVAALRDSSYFMAHKLTAIQIGTYIDNLKDRETAKALAANAMCYVDTSFCDANKRANRTLVAQVATIITKWYQSDFSLNLLHKLSATTDITNDAINITFVDKTYDTENWTPIEFAFELNSAMTHDQMQKIMHDLGMNFQNSYDYWLFYTNQQDTWSTYGYWLDNEYYKTPPAALTLFARILVGPASAAYGYWTGTDMFTGEDLSGWDYVLNLLDFIPAFGEIWDIGSGIIKYTKFVGKTGVVRVVDKVNAVAFKTYNNALKGINYTCKASKYLVMRCMTWGITAKWLATEKILALVGKNGDEIAKIYPGKIEIDKNYLVTDAGGTAFTFGTDAEIFVDGQKQTATFEVVKKSDGEVGFRIKDAGSLVNSLPETLKKLHERLILGGVSVKEEGQVLKYYTFDGQELAKIEDGNFSVIPGKGNIPDPHKYLKDAYIQGHIHKFKEEGCGFIVVKSWTTDSKYPAFPPRKFVGLKSEMDLVIQKYKSSGNDWKVLRDELNLGINTDLSAEEIYYVNISGNDSRYSFDIPNGNEAGAIIGEWTPSGYTKNGTAEAALIGSETIVHNKSINDLLNFFNGNWEKIK